MTSTFAVFGIEDEPRLAEARRIREVVFCQEQSVPPALEWDGQDAAATHFLLRRDGRAVATARTRPYADRTWKIERVAVLKPNRGTGAGREIMATVLGFLRQRPEPVRAYLHAQTEVADFYARLGFVRQGGFFVEAEIPHVAMALADLGRARLPG